MAESGNQATWSHILFISDFLLLDTDHTFCSCIWFSPKYESLEAECSLPIVPKSDGYLWLVQVLIMLKSTWIQMSIKCVPLAQCTYIDATFRTKKKTQPKTERQRLPKPLADYTGRHKSGTEREIKRIFKYTLFESADIFHRHMFHYGSIFNDCFLSNDWKFVPIHYNHFFFSNFLSCSIHPLSVFIYQTAQKSVLAECISECISTLKMRTKRIKWWEFFPS